MINDSYCVINLFTINVVQQTIQVTIVSTTKKFYLTVRVCCKFVFYNKQTYLQTFNLCKYILLYLIQNILSLQTKGFQVRRPPNRTDPYFCSSDMYTWVTLCAFEKSQIRMSDEDLIFVWVCFVYIEHSNLTFAYTSLWKIAAMGT